MRATRQRAAVIGHTGRGDYGHGLDIAMRDHPALELVAVADADDAGRQQAAERLGGVRAYGDYVEMLDREKPRFVAVAPRWIDQHRAMIVACAERGIHVFCEKPLAPTLADCDAIADACARHHVKLAMAFQTRYSPRFEKALALIESGAIGQVLELRGRGKEDARAGGEDLWVLGTHIFDMMRAVAGEPAWCVGRVSVEGRAAGSADVREGAEGLGLLAGDRIDAMFGFAGSPVAGHFASARSEPASRRFGLQVLGTKGWVWVGMGALPAAWHCDDPAWTSGTAARPITDPSRERTADDQPVDIPMCNQWIVSDLIRSVEADDQPRAGLREGVGAVEMVLAVFAAHAAGQAIELPARQREAHPLTTLRED